MRERLQKVERMERVMSVEQTNKTGTEMGGTINGWLRGVKIVMMDYRDLSRCWVAFEKEGRKEGSLRQGR